MLKIWRNFVVWLRSILVALFVTKKPIDWDKKGKELGEIIIDTTETIKKRIAEPKIDSPKRPNGVPRKMRWLLRRHRDIK